MVIVKEEKDKLTENRKKEIKQLIKKHKKLIDYLKDK